jgi:hypothetical protein
VLGKTVESMGFPTGVLDLEIEAFGEWWSSILRNGRAVISISR